MADSYYATVTELQERSTRTFGAATPITTTQAGVMLDQISAQLDGILGRDEGTLGDSDTVPEWAKQAVLGAAIAYVNSVYEKGTPLTQQELNDLLRDYTKNVDAYPNSKFFFGQERPNSSGNWD